MLQRLREAVDRGEDDEGCYGAMARCFMEEIQSSEEHTRMKAKYANESGDYRSKKRVKEIGQLLPREFRAHNVLDIGCAEGNLTVPIGRDLLGLSEDKIFGCDVRDVQEQAGMRFETFDGVHLKHADNSIS